MAALENHWMCLYGVKSTKVLSQDCNNLLKVNGKVGHMAIWLYVVCDFKFAPRYLQNIILCMVKKEHIPLKKWKAPFNYFNIIPNHKILVACVKNSIEMKWVWSHYDGFAIPLAHGVMFHYDFMINTTMFRIKLTDTWSIIWYHI